MASAVLDLASILACRAGIAAGGLDTDDAMVLRHVELLLDLHAAEVDCLARGVGGVAAIAAVAVVLVQVGIVVCNQASDTAPASQT